MCSFKQQWWSDLIMYVLDVFNADLKRLGLHEAVRAACFRINISVPNFFYAILEMYCRHQAYFLRQSVSWGWHSMRCEKYPISPWAPGPTRNTSHVLRSWRNWRRMNRPYMRCTENWCAMSTFALISTRVGNVNNLKSWVEYLFSVMDWPLEILQTLVADKWIAKALKAEGYEDIVLIVHLEGVSRCNANRMVNNTKMQQSLNESCKRSIQIKKWSRIP